MKQDVHEKVCVPSALFLFKSFFFIKTEKNLNEAYIKL